MANLLKTLIPILFLLATAATTARSQSTSFDYEFYRNGTTGLTLQGDAQLPSQSTFLRLTRPVNNLVGRVLYAEPIMFSQTGRKISFETTFTFGISGSQNPADGITFFIAPVGSKPPNDSAGGNLGLFDSSGQAPGVFAVEYDTYPNDWDPTYSHIGVDLGSRSSRKTAPVWIPSVDQMMTVNIIYVNNEIKVTVSQGASTSDLTYQADLSLSVPQQVQVGLSASTGLSVATHEIYSWKFKSTMAAAESEEQLIRQFV